MAVRTVTVDLKLNASQYLAQARAVIQINRRLDDSFNDIAASAAAAGTAAADMGRDLQRMGARARLAERQVRNLREEIDRLIAAQAAAAAGAPIPNIGGAGGRGMGSMMGMLVSPMGVGIATAIAAAAPLIGAALTGVILTVLGGGALAVGIAAAVKDEKVRAAWGEFGEFLKEEFRSYGQAFDVPLIASAERFHDRFASISPKIRATLAEMASAIGPLTEGLIGFIESAGPGVKEGLLASLQVLESFAASLPGLGADVGDFFALLAGGAEGAADGVGLLIDVLGESLAILGTYLGMYSMLYAGMVDLPDWAKMAGGLSFQALTDGASSAIVPIAGIGYQADETASAVERLTRSLQGLTEGFNSQFDAAIQFEEAMDNLKESVEQNGRSMDIGTEKGRANARALMDVFAAARATYEANIASGMSAQEAARKYNEQIEAARRAAIAAGMAADEVNRLAAAQRNLPDGKTIVNTVITRFRTEGGPNYNRVPGVQIAQRDGGIVYARDGLMAFGGAAGVASGGRPLIGFAEAGTGGEAFIARNAPASRSLAIANVAAGWHGGQVVPKGWGGGSVVVVKPYIPTNGNREIADAVTNQIRLDVQHQSRGDVQRHFGGGRAP